MSEIPVYLVNSATGKLVEACLSDEITDEHLGMWNRAWVPEMMTHKERWWKDDSPEDAHWDWKAKVRRWRTLLSYQSFALACGGELQGMLLVNTLKSARIEAQFGKPLVYVEFVSTAPWNRTEMRSPPKYRGVGRIFMIAAVQASLEAGYKGRIGLHSLPRAEESYEVKCGMTRLGTDSAYENLTYFEMTEKQADTFRRQYTKKR